MKIDAPGLPNQGPLLIITMEVAIITTFNPITLHQGDKIRWLVAIGRRKVHHDSQWFILPQLLYSRQGHLQAQYLPPVHFPVGFFFIQGVLGDQPAPGSTQGYPGDYLRL